MDIADAQRDVRETYVGGFHGQLVSGALWLVAAAVATVVSHAAGIVTLLGGGGLIFPIITLLLKISGRRGSLPPGHPMAALAPCRSPSRCLWACSSRSQPPATAKGGSSQPAW